MNAPCSWWSVRVVMDVGDVITLRDCRQVDVRTDHVDDDQQQRATVARWHRSTEPLYCLLAHLDNKQFTVHTVIMPSP